MNNRILFVDEDLEVLSYCQRILRNKYVVKTAVSPDEALQTLRMEPPFAVIVSEYNLQKENGAEFLTKVKKSYPDCIRVILTCFANNDAVEQAINNAEVFRVLTKPLLHDTLLRIIEEAVQKYQKNTSDSTELDRTIKGSVKILIEVLSKTSPTAFKHSAKIKTVARSIADQMGLKNTWEIELASLLSQIGIFKLPEDVVMRYYNNEPLTLSEKKLLATFPAESRKILNNIPYFSKIAEAVELQQYAYDGSYPKDSSIYGDKLPMISRILKLTCDFSRLVLAGESEIRAVNKLRNNAYLYDPRVLTALLTLYKLAGSNYIIKSIPFKNLRIGMILADDLKDEELFVLVTKGQEITDSILTQLINLSTKKRILEPIRVREKNSP